VALPNGYQIVRDRSDTPTLVKRSGGVVLKGPVAAYTVVHGVVTGLIQPAAGSVQKVSSRSADAQQGYFVLDTRTGYLNAGLSKDDWSERLKGFGITEAPELAAPLLPR
jgi:hypothetical protein